MSAEHPAFDRRRFLQGSVVSGAGALAITGNSAALAGAIEAASKATVVLHDPRLTLDAGVAASLRASGARIIALDGDPVRLWRGAQAQLLAHRDTKLFGVTRWPDFLLVRGLAAESRRLVRHESLGAASGVMTWLIA